MQHVYDKGAMLCQCVVIVMFVTVVFLVVVLLGRTEPNRRHLGPFRVPSHHTCGG